MSERKFHWHWYRNLFDCTAKEIVNFEIFCIKRNVIVLGGLTSISHFNQLIFWASTGNPTYYTLWSFNDQTNENVQVLDFTNLLIKNCLRLLLIVFPVYEVYIWVNSGRYKIQTGDTTYGLLIKRCTNWYR